MVGRSSLTVRPKGFEPAHGLAERLAHRSGVDFASIARFIGLDGEALLRGEGADRVAAAAGQNADRIVAATPRRTYRNRDVTVGLAHSNLGDWTRTSRRFCPLCLTSDLDSADRSGEPQLYAAWHRTEWDFLSVRTCVAHRVVLRQSCDRCSQTQRWSQGPLHLCACGSDLRQVSTRTARSDLDRRLVAAIHGMAALPDELSGAGLGQISAACERLGEVARGWSLRRPEILEAEAIGLRDAGLDTLLSGSSGIEELFDAVVLSAPTRSGLCASYGWVWTSWLGVPSPSPIVRNLAQQLRDHAGRLGIIQPVVVKPTVSLTQMRRMLGVGHPRARRIASARGLRHPASLAGVNMALDRVAVECIETELGGLLDASEASVRLGTSRTRFRELVAAGVGPAAAPGYSSELLRYRISDLDDWFDKLVGSAPSISVTPVGCAGLPAACRSTGVSLVVAVSALQRGDLAPVCRLSTGGLPSIVVTHRELRALRSPTLNIAFAAEVLGLHYDAARWLAGEGRLGASPGSVDQEGIDNFRATLATSRTLGGEFGISGAVVTHRLKAAGISPRFGPPECRQAIYDRGLAELALGVAYGSA